jgi:hypothetical protein
VETAGSFTSLATINRCRIEQNSTAGLEAFTPGTGTPSVDVSVADCVISGNGIGISADGNGSTLVLVRVSTSSITGNTTGITSSGIGQVISRVNNTLEKNVNGNAFSNSYSAR